MLSVHLNYILFDSESRIPSPHLNPPSYVQTRSEDGNATLPLTNDPFSRPPVVPSLIQFAARLRYASSRAEITATSAVRRHARAISDDLFESDDQE